MVVCCFVCLFVGLFVLVCFVLLQLCPILAYFFLIEALIELRKMLLRKKLFANDFFHKSSFLSSVSASIFGNCSTPIYNAIYKHISYPDYPDLPNLQRCN